MRRLVVFRLCVLLVFASLVSQLWVLQFREGASLSTDARGNTERPVYERPLRGEIFARDSKTILAESLPSYTIGILPSQLPGKVRGPERLAMFAWLDDLLHFQSTLVVTPSEQLTYEPRLKQDIEQLTGPFNTPPPSITEAFTITVPLSRSVEAFNLTHTYSTTLEFYSPIESTLANAGLPAYETVPLTTTRDLAIGRIIEENKSVSPGLPGVQVEQNYQRSYPKSSEIMSLSHLLGYVGPIDQCGIIQNNPYRFWSSLYITDTETVTTTVEERRVDLIEQCGLDPFEIDRQPDRGIQYLLTDRIGKDGLEYAYEADLRGQLGEKKIEVDSQERLVSEPVEMRPTRLGNNLVLTIDYELQKQTEQILRKWIDESERRRQTSPPPAKEGQANKQQYFPIEAGVAIALEVKTGRVLSMVSWPAFDNNIFNRRRTQQEVDTIFNPPYPKQAPAINQSIQGLFPPGSTWKQFSAAAALEGGAIGPDSQIRDPGYIDVKNTYYEKDPRFDQRFPNSIRRDNGWITVRQALQVSSNVFFQSVIGGTEFVRNLADNEKRAAWDETGERLADMAFAFGFGRPTGIPLPGEYRGVVPSKSWKKAQPGAFGQESWTIGDIYNTTIGQGNLQVTPIQLAVASAAIANGGTLYQPQIVEKIIDPDGELVREITPVENGKLPVSQENLRVIREGMRLSITDGIDTCARKDVSGLDIAGKTGTAEYLERLDPKKGPTEDNIRKRSHAWFAGFAPYDDPQIEVIVLVEGAGDMNDGSATIAVPAVTEIMQAYFKVTPPIDPATPIPPYNLPCH
ncbi:MAG: peptidoglycan glycosyltransferase [Chloroflexi bacterium]|nr:peptidoglycan glycosyltransferase [Chloroflexota bacterium]